MSLDITTSNVLQEQGLSAYENILLMVTKDKTVVRLTEMLYDMNERLKVKGTTLGNLPQWHSVSAVAKVKGLSPDAVRKQLQNGDFEESVDFKYNGSRIKINQGAVERIQRKRRSSNG